jgi:carboxymethylenebutenolidase
VSQRDADAELFELYDEYCHSGMPRREFLMRAAALTAMVGLAGCGQKAEELLPEYEKAATVSFTDPRIVPRFVDFDSPGGHEGTRGYLVTPAREGKFGAVLVVHENRGLNPYIEDVARRVAVEGFLAFAPDALAPVGGYPGNDDDGKALQAKLDPAMIRIDMRNAASFVQGHATSNGRLGVTGFCFGGGVSNHLAVELGPSLHAAAPFYGQPPDLERVGEIRARMVIHYAEDDPRVNARKADYLAALEAAKVEFQAFEYPGTRHGFHNDSTPRYDHAAATLAWQRTIDLFRRALR